MCSKRAEALGAVFKVCVKYIMIVCVCSARVQLQSTALLSCCNNVLCALEVFPLTL
jgi:hypothetical protein